MLVKITDAAVSIRHIPIDEIGLREHSREIFKDPRWDHLWVYEVVDKKKFFLAVVKYGITFHVHEHECSV